MAARAEKTEVLIIGAGISGLLLAQSLKKKGWPVTILEKSPGLGGRLATRRTVHGPLDHGLDFISKRDLSDELLAPLLATGILTECPAIKDGLISERGMSALAKALAEGLTIHKQHRATKLSIAPGAMKWRIAVEGKNHLLTASHIIMTAPVPQALELLEASFPQQLKEWVHELSAVSYQMALVLLGMAKSHGMRLPKKAEAPFEKIIDNAAKGLATTPGLLTIIARPEFSKKWFNASDEAIIAEMTQRLSDQHDVKLNDVQLKKWRYSQVTTPFQKAYAQAPIPIPLYLIGDGFCGGGLGGAIQSANALTKLF